MALLNNPGHVNYELAEYESSQDFFQELVWLLPLRYHQLGINKAYKWLL
jgi:hypothetical protein